MPGEGSGGLLKHQLQTVVQLGPAVVDVEHGVALVRGGGLQPLNAQDNVSKGTFHGAYLCVGHVGVYNQQILYRNGEFLIQGPEVSMAVQNEKQLRTAVGMQF